MEVSRQMDIVLRVHVLTVQVQSWRRDVDGGYRRKMFGIEKGEEVVGGRECSCDVEQ
jgi:hypothetical protein